ncbi:PLP-dependent transferase, partial [Neoconidiobolus thromboides FSU 785]
MEGTIPKLNEILELKKKYKFYIYLDEAHSIGALGSRGRGVCDLLGVDPRSIDIMMGTFTKSFGASGGYIAGTKALIQRLRVTNHNSLYGETMSVPVLQQTISSMQEIMGESDSMYPHEGKKRLDQLAFNSHYFFTKLKSMGFTLIGSCGSPVIPMMIYHSSKIAAFSRECLAAGIAVVVVGYPATPVMRDRVRFCLSAAHTKQDLDASLAIINIIGERLQIKNL